VADLPDPTGYGRVVRDAEGRIPDLTIPVEFEPVLAG